MGCPGESDERKVTKRALRHPCAPAHLRSREPRERLGDLTLPHSALMLPPPAVAAVTLCTLDEVALTLQDSDQVSPDL